MRTDATSRQRCTLLPSRYLPLPPRRLAEIEYAQELLPLEMLRVEARMLYRALRTWAEACAAAEPPADRGALDLAWHVARPRVHASSWARSADRRLECEKVMNQHAGLEGASFATLSFAAIPASAVLEEIITGVSL